MGHLRIYEGKAIRWELLDGALLRECPHLMHKVGLCSGCVVAEDLQDFFRRFQGEFRRGDDGTCG